MAQGRWEGSPWLAVPQKLYSDTRLSAADFRVFMVLAAHLPNTGEQIAWPSNRRIAQMAHADERTVRRSIDRLIEFGYLAVEGRFDEDGRQRSNLYRLLDGVAEVTRGEGEIAPLPLAVSPPLELDEEELDTSSRTETDVSVLPEVAEIDQIVPISLPIWDALVTVFGEPPDSQRSRYGRIVKDLSNGGYTGTDVLERANAWPLHFENATLTPEALLKFWGQLGRPPLRLTKTRQKEINEQLDRQQRRQRLLERLENR